MYGGLTYHQIFNGNKHYGVLNICASLKVKNLHLVDKTKRLYLTLGGYDGGEKGILISKNAYITTFITGARNLMIHIDGAHAEWIELEYKFEE